MNETAAAHDPGSLQNLNDIVMPTAVPWWPPAPGWYVVGAVVLLLVAWLLIRVARRWVENRYRREALRELRRIRAESTAVPELPALLKRCALSAWPREQVASMTGPAWHEFLDQSAAMDRFRMGQGEALERLSYAAGGRHGLTESELHDVFEASETWLRTHRAVKG